MEAGNECKYFRWVNAARQRLFLNIVFIDRPAENYERGVRPNV
jgi:hypothetical protein